MLNNTNISNLILLTDVFAADDQFNHINKQKLLYIN